MENDRTEYPSTISSSSSQSLRRARSSSSSTMPPAQNKARSSTGRMQQHQRTASGGSRVGLNNLPTDSTQAKQSNLKKSGNSSSAVDLLQGRTSHLRAAHLTSNSRVRSKDQLTATHKRAHAPPSNKGKQQQAQHRPQRPNFSIARSDDTTSTDSDDDEWVSSESGAATPQINHVEDAEVEEENTDGHETMMPIERQGPIDGLRLPENKMNGGNNIYGNADRAPNGRDDATTPRAERAVDLTRVETVRPDDIIGAAAAPPATTPRQDDMNPPPIVRVQAQSTPTTPVPTSPPPPVLEQPTVKAPPLRQVRSEAPSPTQLRQKSAANRTTLVRRTSTHGDGKKDMPPHPLIRGQSYHGAALRPARLAPLTVNSEAAQAQMTASPSTPSRTGSPSFLSASFRESPTAASTDSQDRYPSRKNSISSLHSVTTLPAPASSSRFAGGWGKPDRTRTLSTISTSSSSAALTALSTLPSRPSSPPLVVRFPAEGRRDPNEGFHQLLPPQFLARHMTVLTKYNPLYESYERVMRAKHGQ